MDTMGLPNRGATLDFRIKTIFYDEAITQNGANRRGYDDNGPVITVRIPVHPWGGLYRSSDVFFLAVEKKDMGQRNVSENYLGYYVTPICGGVATHIDSSKDISAELLGFGGAIEQRKRQPPNSKYDTIQ